MQKGNAITLKYQHDHIEDAVIIYQSGKCIVYLVADEAEHPDAFVKLEFERAQCIRSAATDCSPAIGIYPEKMGVSFIVELTNSNWPVEANQKYTYAGSGLKPREHHYVVSNHDVFHEILANSFSESLVEQGSPEYGVVKYHFQ